jgi:hypothetical protein
LKIRTTNDITVFGCTVIKRNTVCIARPKAERRCCGGRWGIESPSNRHSTVSFKKTHSQCQGIAGAADLHGKLVASFWNM